MALHGPRYDRRVSEDFLALFLDGGPAAELPVLATVARYPVDFHLRRAAKGGAEHASLYVGLTDVLKLSWTKQGHVRLSTHPTHVKKGRFDPAWSSPMTVAELSQAWPDVELYLGRVVPIATESHASREGAVQAAVSSFRDASLAVLDREVTPSFPDQAYKTAFMGACRNPILRVLETADLGFGGAPTGLGSECDVLALDDRGRVLAVEVKPLAGSSVAWAPAQAVMYARVLQRWIDEDGEEDSPGAVLEGVHRQRHALGLVPPLPVSISDRPRVTPVVAVQRGASPEIVRRLVAVKTALDAADLGVPEIEIREVSLAGRLVPLDESRAADGAPRAIQAGRRHG